MIAMYFKLKYREQIKTYFNKWDVKYNSISFNASEGSVYYVKDEIVWCSTNHLFNQEYPKVKIIDPKEIYGEY